MTREEKARAYKEVWEITVQNILDWLDGCAVLCTITTVNIDHIGSYRKKQFHYAIFSKEIYTGIYLSNKRWLDSSKSILEEYIVKKNKYWKMLSRNSIKKCRNKDSTIRIIFRNLSPYLHFRIAGRSYEYINIEKIISKDGRSIYVHDKSKEISLLQSKIWDMEHRVIEAKEKLSRLKFYQSVHEELHTKINYEQ